MDIMVHLSSNTSKYYRIKTQGERVNEVLQDLLKQIHQEHENLMQMHMAALEQAASEEDVDSQRLPHLQMKTLNPAFLGVLTKLTAQRSTKMRTQHSHVIAHLCDLFLHMGSHYHSHGITNMQQQVKWQPGMQGVRFSLT
jgi:hypothetical protein